MLKNKLRITVPFVLVLFILSLTNITAFAKELPDLNSKGTLTISMEKEGKAVPGGEFEIYRIANAAVSNGCLKYVLANDFKDCGISFDNPESDKFASKLEKYIKSNKISGIRKTVDNDGIAKFGKLGAGMYFVMQNEAAKGYDKANSFTVSLPDYEDGKYNYTVKANPKFSFSSSKNKTTPTTIKPSKPTEPKLPQTGQLNLPIPILTASGLCMFVVGLVIRCGAGKGKHEE